MKLKYYLVFTAFALSSCGEGFFEQYPSNDITEGNFYKTDDDFNQGVVSCYAKLKTMMSFHLTEIGYRSDENILESMAVSTQDRYDIDNFIETASNGILNDIWDAWYNGIYRCNDVLDHMNGVQIPNYNKKVKSGMKKTAKGTRFLQADGSYAASQWLCYKGSWYYFYRNGYMAKSSFIGKRYVGRTGKMIVNRTMTIGKYRYTFDKDGEIIKKVRKSTKK